MRTVRWQSVNINKVTPFVLSFILCPDVGWAYNWGTHSLMVRRAVEVMSLADKVTAPEGVDVKAWDDYTRRLVESTKKLAVLRTGLPALNNESLALLDDAAPLQDMCGYHKNHDKDDRAFNLLHADLVRISDFCYLVRREPDPCFYDIVKLPNSPPNTDVVQCSLDSASQVQVLGATLGWHAADIDEHLGDTVLWKRPTSAGFLGAIQEATNRALEFGGGALLLPFVCLGKALFGSGCNIRDSFNLAERINPVRYIEGIIPGSGNVFGNDYTGLWHFVDVDARINRYNDVRGVLYEDAGPAYPGAVDIAIMAAADLIGLSLNANSSDGPDIYGRYDRDSRSSWQWNTPPLGHLEFSPVQNLAKYGWDAYQADPTTARVLGWPLHAIGDAAEPHHVTGTTSWGHRPYEDAVDDPDVAVNLLPPPLNNDAFRAFQKHVLRIGFDAFQSFEADPSIQNYIIREARSTRELEKSSGDWAFKDSESVGYFTPGLKELSVDVYKQEPGQLRPLVEQGVGWIIGLLGRAGELARDLGSDDAGFCQRGDHFTGKGSTGCEPGPAPPSSTPPLLPKIYSETCVPEGGHCEISTDCCSGKSCLDNTCGSRVH